MTTRLKLTAMVIVGVVLGTSPAAAGTTFWVYNATDFNTVSVLTPSQNATTVKSNVAYEAKSDADGDTLTMEIAGNQFTITDQSTRCANVPGSWEMTIDQGSGGTNSRVGSQCVHIDTAGCGNLGIVIQKTSDGKGVTVGVKDRGSSACGGSFSDWVSWIKTGISIVSTIASL